MERILHAAKSEFADIQVQITGDCPLIDSEIIDNLIKLILSNQDLDFVSNEIERSFPVGLDCRVFKVSALEKQINSVRIISTEYMDLHLCILAKEKNSLNLKFLSTKKTTSLVEMDFRY